MRYALCAAVAVATGLCFFCYGPPLVATALRPFWLFRGVLAAAAATSNLEGVLTTSHIHFGSSQAKTH